MFGARSMTRSTSGFEPVQLKRTRASATVSPSASAVLPIFTVTPAPIASSSLRAGAAGSANTKTVILSMKEQNYHARADSCEPGGGVVRNSTQETTMRSSPFGSRRGGIIAGLLLSGLVVLCLVIAGSIFLARNIRVQTTARNGGDDVTIDTPVGHLSVRAHEKPGMVASD